MGGGGGGGDGVLSGEVCRGLPEGLSGGLAISGAIWEDCLEGWLSLGLAGECYLTSPAFVCSGARTSEGS